MKISRIIIVVVSVALVTSMFSGYAINKKYQRKLNEFNECYDYIVDCYENGFDKDNAKEMLSLFEKVNTYEITQRYYKNSKFNNISISFSGETYDFGNKDFSANAEHCKKLIDAMHLACIFVTSPEELQDDLNEKLQSNSEFSFLFEKI